MSIEQKLKNLLIEQQELITVSTTMTRAGNIYLDINTYQMDRGHKVEFMLSRGDPETFQELVAWVKENITAFPIIMGGAKPSLVLTDYAGKEPTVLPYLQHLLDEGYISPQDQSNFEKFLHMQLPM